MDEQEVHRNRPCDPGKTLIAVDADTVISRHCARKAFEQRSSSYEADIPKHSIVSTHLQVNSEHLKKTLREIIGSYPGQSFATKAVAIQYPPECLYHYRHELEEAGKSVQACPEAMEHHAILTQYIDEYFQEVITEVANLQDQGLVSFDLLWVRIV